MYKNYNKYKVKGNKNGGYKKVIYKKEGTENYAIEVKDGKYLTTKLEILDEYGIQDYVKTNVKDTDLQKSMESLLEKYNEVEEYKKKYQELKTGLKQQSEILVGKIKENMGIIELDLESLLNKEKKNKKTKLNVSCKTVNGYVRVMVYKTTKVDVSGEDYEEYVKIESDYNVYVNNSQGVVNEYNGMTEGRLTGDIYLLLEEYGLEDVLKNVTISVGVYSIGESLVELVYGINLASKLEDTNKEDLEDFCKRLIELVEGI